MPLNILQGGLRDRQYLAQSVSSVDVASAAAPTPQSPLTFCYFIRALFSPIMEKRLIASQGIVSM